MFAGGYTPTAVSVNSVVVDYITFSCPSVGSIVINGACLCPPGTYDYMSSCKSCPAGTFNSQPGSSDITSCSNCPSGTFSTIGASSCTLCTSGYYSSVLNSTSCSKCPVASFSLPGASSVNDCTNCPLLTGFGSIPVATGSSYPYTSPTWGGLGVVSKNLSIARFNLAASVNGQYVIFGGGHDSFNVYYDAVDILNTLNNTWIRSSLSRARTYISSASAGNFTIFYGGYHSDGAWSKVVDIFDIVRFTWSSFALAYGRYIVQGISLYELAFFAGGNDEGWNTWASARVDIFNSTSLIWTTNQFLLSFPRINFAVTNSKLKAYFIGGNNNWNSYLNNIDIYDYATATWSSSQFNNVGRQYPAAATAGHFLIIGGGYYGGQTSYVDIYNELTMVWSTSSLSISRYQHAAAAVGCQVIFGGGLPVTTSVEIYDVYRQIWKVIPQGLSVARYYLIAVTIGDIAIFAAGRNNADFATFTLDYISPTCSLGYIYEGKCQCIPGTYSNGTGCAPCPNGKYSNTYGATSSDQCLNCTIPGSFAIGGATSCVNCPSGYSSLLIFGNYSFTSLLGSCSICPNGTYSSASTNYNCTLCPLGSYSSAGFSACTLCPPGTYRDQLGGSGISSCTTCAINTFSALPGANSSSCGPCGPLNNLLQASSTTSISRGGRRLFYPVVLGNFAFIGGGYDDTYEGSRRSVDMLDISNGTWTYFINVMGNARYYLAAAATGRKVLFAGGNGHRTVDFYDIISRTWTTNNAGLAYGKDQLSAISVQELILFGGGTSNGKYVDMYNTTSGTWTVWPNGLYWNRYLMGAVTVGNLGFFCNGYDSSIGSSNYVDIFDYSSLSWYTTKMINYRYEGTCTAVASTVICAGGRYSGIVATVDLYDTIINTWSTGQLSTYRTSLASASSGCRAFFAGGNGSPTGHSNVIDVYLATTRTWSVLDVGLTSPRYQFGGFFVGGMIFFAGGYNDNYGIQNLIDFISFDCPSGSYIINGLCKCKPGFYLGSNYICNACPAGTYSTTVGAFSISTCNICPSGRYSSLNATFCIFCVQGKFSNVTGSTTINNCLSCGFGLFTVNAGSTLNSSCISCPATSSSNFFIGSNSPLKTAVFDNAAVGFGTKVLVAGGGTTSADILDVTTGIWRNIPNALQYAKYRLVGVLIGSYVMFVGGSGYQNAEIYDINSNTWSYVSNALSTGRDYFDGAVVNDNFALFGGGNRHIDFYNLTSNVWGVYSNALSYGGQNLCATSASGYVFFTSGNSYQSIVNGFDSSLNTWSLNFYISTLPRFYQGCVSVGSIVILAGGQRVSTMYSDVDIYDTSTNIVTTTSLSHPKCFMASAVVGCKAVFSGGYSSSIDYDDVDIYDTNKKTWAYLSGLSVGRGRFAAAVAGGIIVLSGGYVQSIASATKIVDYISFSCMSDSVVINGTCVCPAGTYSTSKQCLACPSGKFSIDGSVNITSCIACSAGSWSIARSSSCTSCLPGKYSTNSGATSLDSCTICPGSTYSVYAGSTSASACISCPNSKFYSSGFGNTQYVYKQLCSASYGSTLDIAGGSNSQASILDLSTGFWTVSSGAITGNAANCVAVATSNVKLLFASGKNNRYVDIYDLISKSWTSNPNILTVGRDLYAATTIGNYSLFGGPSNRNVDIYNSTYNSWGVWTNVLSYTRQYLAAGTVLNYAMFSGGYANSGLIVDVYDYIYNIWFTTSFINGRWRHACATVGSVYICGGGTGNSGVTNTVEIFNTVTLSWTTTAFSVARTNIAAASYNCKVVFFGGDNEAGIYFNNIDVYDLLTLTWYSISNGLNTPRSYISTTVLNGIFVLAGGSNSTDLSSLDYFSFICPIGSIIINGICRCPAGGYNNGTYCVNCPAGTYSIKVGGNSINSCVSCPVGTWSNPISSTSTCKYCAYGLYSNTINATSVSSCISCSNGYTVLVSGASSNNSCVRCPSTSGSYTYSNFSNSAMYSFTNSTLFTAYSDSLPSPRNFFSGLSIGPVAFFAGGTADTIIDVYNSTDGVWKTINGLSVIRLRPVGAVIGSRLIFAGGFLTSSCDIYESVTNTLTFISSCLSVQRDNFTGSATNNIAIFGGSFSRNVDVYNYTSNSWRVIVNALSFSRQYAAAGAVFDFIIFSGGNGSVSSSNFGFGIDIYDTNINAWTTSSHLSSFIRHACTTVGSLFICGGGESTFGTPSSSVNIYDAISLSLVGSSLSAPRSLISAVSLGCKAIFAGGTSVQSSSIIDIYDVSTSTWFVLSLGLSIARHNLVLLNLNSIIFFVGGWNTFNGTSRRIDFLTFTCVIGASLSSGNCNCPLGTYNNNTHCIACPFGTYSISINALNNSTCLSCPVGTWSSAGSSYCSSCSPGKYSSVSRSSACTNCPPSTYSKIAGATSSAMCALCNNITYFVTSNYTISYPRVQLSTVVISDLAIFAGGLINSQISTNVIDILNMTSGSWMMASLNISRSYISSIVVGSLAIFAGGLINVTSVSAVVDVFNIFTGVWSISLLSHARYGIASCAVGDFGVFSGGMGLSNNYFNTTDIYNRSSGIWSVLPFGMSAPRLAHSSASTNSLAIFAGGFNSKGALLSVDILDTINFQWANTELSVARYYMAALNFGSLTLFAGGEDASNIYSLVEIYDSINRVWSSTSLPSSQTRMAATLFGCKAIFAGGMSIGKIDSKTVYSYDFMSKNWDNLSPLSYARFSLAALTFNSLLIFAGGNSSLNGLSDVIDYYSADCNYGGFILHNGICKCPPSTYSNGTVCISCAPGSYSNVIGLIGSCSLCPIGKYSYSGASTCVFCAPGSYSNVQGTSNCTLCPKNTFSSITGSTSVSTCLSCNLTMYSNNIGAPSASTCAPCHPIPADNTSTLQCAPSFIHFGDIIFCNTSIKLNGRTWFSYGTSLISSFTEFFGNSTTNILLSSSLSFSNISIVPSSSFPSVNSEVCLVNASSFTFAMQSQSFLANNSNQLALLNSLNGASHLSLLINDGISSVPFKISLSWLPDDTSFINCDINVNIYPWSKLIHCSLVAQRLGILTTTTPDSFNMSIVQGSIFGEISNLIAFPIPNQPSAFYNFTFKVNSSSYFSMFKKITLSHGITLKSGYATSPSYDIFIQSVPDTSSYITCNPSVLSNHGVVYCEFNSRCYGSPLNISSETIFLAMNPPNIGFITLLKSSKPDVYNFSITSFGISNSTNLWIYDYRLGYSVSYALLLSLGTLSPFISPSYDTHFGPLSIISAFKYTNIYIPFSCKLQFKSSCYIGNYSLLTDQGGTWHLITTSSPSDTLIFNYSISATSGYFNFTVINDALNLSAILFTLRVPTDCGPGFYIDSSGLICIPCPAGAFSSVNFTTTSCSLCSPGTYSALTGSNSSAVCLPCPVATYSVFAGNSNISQCIFCPVGKYSLQTGASSPSVCLPCVAGTYSFSEGVTSCTSCYPGSYSTKFGATSISTCNSCPLNYYSTVTGSSTASNCISCSNGYYNFKSYSSSIIDCIACQPNQPDISSFMTCSPLIVSFGETITCISSPQFLNNTIYTSGSIFSASLFASNGNSTVTSLLLSTISISSVLPVSSTIASTISDRCPINASSFVYSFSLHPFTNSQSQIQLLQYLSLSSQFFYYGVSLADGVSGTPLSVTLLFPPDDSTYILCSSSSIFTWSIILFFCFIYLAISVNCLIHSRRLNISTPAYASMFSLSILENPAFGSFSSILSTLTSQNLPSTTFNFTFYLNPNLLLSPLSTITIRHGIIASSGYDSSGGYFRIKVESPPDRTSTLTCSPAILLPWSSCICTFVAKNAGNLLNITSDLLEFNISPFIGSLQFFNSTSTYPVVPSFMSIFSLSINGDSFSENKAYIYPNLWIEEYRSGVSFVAVLASSMSAPNIRANLSVGFKNISYPILTVVPQTTLYVPIAPKLLNSTVYFESRYFNLTVPGNDGYSSIPNVLSSFFLLNFTFGTAVGDYNVILTNIITNQSTLLFQVSVIVSMDNTSSIFCPPTATVNSQINCIIIPRRNGVVVDANYIYWNFTTWALAPTLYNFDDPGSIKVSYNYLPGTPYYIGKNATEYGYFGLPDITHGPFNITYFVGSRSGIVLLNNGFSDPALIVIFDDPEDTDLSVIIN